MSKFEFKNLSLIGINVFSAKNESELTPEDIYIETIKLCATDMKALSLFVTYHKYMSWAFDFNIIRARASDLDQKEKAILFGLMKKVGQFKPDKTIPSSPILYSDKKLFQVYLNLGQIDKDFEECGIYLPIFTEEDISKYGSVIQICKANKFLMDRFNSLPVSVISIPGLNPDTFKRKIPPEEQIDYHMANLKLISHYDLSALKATHKESFSFLMATGDKAVIELLEKSFLT